MNKDQIIQAIKLNASPKQLEQIAAIVGTELLQVPVTERHVGCVVENHERSIVLDVVELTDDDLDSLRYDGFHFLNPYRVPITHRWSGGEQPVEDHVWVLVQWVDGNVAVLPAGGVIWKNAHNILGYTPLDVIGVEDE